MFLFTFWGIANSISLIKMDLIFFFVKLLARILPHVDLESFIGNALVSILSWLLDQHTSELLAIKIRAQKANNIRFFRARRHL